jgi:hypothetical protein
MAQDPGNGGGTERSGEVVALHLSQAGNQEAAVFAEKIIRYEIIVAYDGEERARFPQDTIEQAIACMEILRHLPAVTKMWINEVTVEQRYEWSRD